MKRIGLVLVGIVLGMQAFQSAFAEIGPIQSTEFITPLTRTNGEHLRESSDGSLKLLIQRGDDQNGIWYCNTDMFIENVSTKGSSELLYQAPFDDRGQKPCVFSIKENKKDKNIEILWCLSEGGGSRDCGMGLKTLTSLNEKGKFGNLQVIGVRSLGVSLIDEGESGELNWIGSKRIIPQFKNTIPDTQANGDQELQALEGLYARWKSVNKNSITLEGIDAQTLKVFEQLQKDQYVIQNYLTQWADKLSSTQREQLFPIILEKIRTLKSSTTRTKTRMYLEFIENSLRKLPL